MKRILSLILALSFVLGVCFAVVSCTGQTGEKGEKGEKGDTGEAGADGLTPFIGENGNWWIGDTDTGVKAKGEDGKDGVDGKDGKDGEDGETPSITISEDGYWVINGKKTKYKAVYNGTAEPASFDDVAADGLSYKKIFIENNLAYTDGFNAKDYGDFKKSAGENTISATKFYSAPYSLKAFGTTSQQVVSENALKKAGEYFVACKVYCSRYSKGDIGIHINDVTVGVSRSTYDFITVADVLSAKSGQNIYMGSVNSANLDGYIDDPVVIDLSIFKTKPSLDTIVELYENYVKLEKAREREEIEHSEKDMYNAFIEYMGEKANEIGMTNSTFVDSVGAKNKSTAYDIAKLLIYAYGYKELDGIWGATNHKINILGGSARTKDVKTLVAIPEITDKYEVIGGKTGTLSGANNLAVIIKIPDSSDLLVVVALCAKGDNSEKNNRYDAVCQIAEAALVKYRDPSADNSKMSVCCDSAIACVIPASGADHTELNVIYAKNEHKKQLLASITKILTVVCTLDYIDDLDTEITYSKFDINNCFWYYKDFYAGDRVTLRDALYAIFLPSSNPTAITLARVTGKVILE